MPWMQTSATEQRLRFAEDFESGQWSMTELCERYGVTRPTGYQWMGRFRVAGGLQGAVQDPRRAILLPAHGHRSLQPDAPRVPRPVVGEDRGGEARVPRPVPRGRPPRSDPDRQRDTVRVDWHPRPVRVERVVGAARHRPSTDSSGESPGERDP